MFGNKAKDKDFANMFLASFQENVKKLEKSGEYAAMLEGFTDDDLIKAAEALKKVDAENEGLQIALNVIETILGSRDVSLSMDEINKNISGVLNGVNLNERSDEEIAPDENTESEAEQNDFE